MLWDGARALGLNPFSPEARALSRHQLLWARFRRAEEQGRDPLKRAEEARVERRNQAALDLAMWVDKHVTR